MASRIGGVDVRGTLVRWARSLCRGSITTRMASSQEWIARGLPSSIWQRCKLRWRLDLGHWLVRL